MTGYINIDPSADYATTAAKIKEKPKSRMCDQRNKVYSRQITFKKIVWGKKIIKQSLSNPFFLTAPPTSQPSFQRATSDQQQEFSTGLKVESCDFLKKCFGLCNKPPEFGVMKQCFGKTRITRVSLKMFQVRRSVGEHPSTREPETAELLEKKEMKDQRQVLNRLYEADLCSGI